MKLKSLLTTLAVAVGITTAAQAWTPNAIWNGCDGDFAAGTSSKCPDGKTVSVSHNDNTLDDDGNIVIGSTTMLGASISGWQTRTKNVIVLRYSNLSVGDTPVAIASIGQSGGGDVQVVAYKSGKRRCSRP